MVWSNKDHSLFLLYFFVVVHQYDRLITNSIPPSHKTKIMVWENKDHSLFHLFFFLNTRMIVWSQTQSLLLIKQRSFVFLTLQKWHLLLIIHFMDQLMILLINILNYILIKCLWIFPFIMVFKKKKEKEGKNEFISREIVKKATYVYGMIISVKLQHTLTIYSDDDL